MNGMSWIEWAQLVVAPVFLAMAGWVVRLEGKVAALNEKLVAHQIHVAQNYPTNTQVEKIADRLTATLEKIEEKVDTLSEHIMRGAQNGRHRAD